MKITTKITESKTAFIRDDRHFTEWMEDAREVLAHIEDELNGPPVAAQAHLAGGGQLPGAVANAHIPLPAANQQFQPVIAANAQGVVNVPPPPALNQCGALPAFAARLPQLCLPNFDGDPLEWPAFWQSFESAVDRLPLEPVDKLNYLHGCL
ncbi:hypothetical protein niasHT_031538 [Heterodera trifolii]|uniref:Uncharacterized protein n=1 Tax=Heterodera trifolii TaxID=157864 RepID=A0ABD2HVX1_9BILA